MILLGRAEQRQQVLSALEQAGEDERDCPDDNDGHPDHQEAAEHSIVETKCPSSTPGADKLYSPAPVKYVNRCLTGDIDTPKFMGAPRPELDRAWHDLLEATMIRYTDDELLLANNATPVRHEDGGYAGGLGISHSLHCLKRLKQYIHPDYYYNHETQDWAELYSHVDHCPESLRQEILCSADANVYTPQWTAHSRVKPTVRVPRPHACVDWAALHGWMQGRAARLDDMVGPPYSLYDGKGEGTGHGEGGGRWDVSCGVVGLSCLGSAVVFVVAVGTRFF
ncbi:hypothetical protein B0T17DRAFT_622765 [Bombardia bombarda]|uniref:Uncharacterized protein n=1 Tax=Bombardia bombarda TaxID=252184 RepID=A0AA39XK33_9PEZI|nr:hypothetical protein B0T17DRAFT_622765 [Bombardia bombarda]